MNIMQSKEISEKIINTYNNNRCVRVFYGKVGCGNIFILYYVKN